MAISMLSVIMLLVWWQQLISKNLENQYRYFASQVKDSEEISIGLKASDARRIFLIQHAIRIWTYLGNCVEEFDKGKFTYDFKRFLAELICLIDGTRDLEMPAINRLLRKFQNERYPQRAG
jgi:hypothetical protein